MKYIHPFAARMAPEIALDKIRTLKPGQIVLDPMTGSGMVLAQSVRSGLNAIGVDLDPLAELISRVGSTPINEKKALKGLDLLLDHCNSDRRLFLSWIDEDAETEKFVDFWFANKQKTQLRQLSYNLTHNPIKLPNTIIDILKVALSRLIITKDPKASLARDTAHSRPHRTIEVNDFDIFNALPNSLEHVLSALNSSSLKGKAKTFICDARKLSPIKDSSIDRIITSPPYLNAIDYMRGHRMSLVWFGYRISLLRSIRSTAIGTEVSFLNKSATEFEGISKKLGISSLDKKNLSMLNRYFLDLVQQTSEAYRVLKNNSISTYVIGNSTIKGIYIKNNEILKIAATQAGFKILKETERDIPINRRYMPINTNSVSSISNRMHTEHVIDFRKTT